MSNPPLEFIETHGRLHPSEPIVNEGATGATGTTGATGSRGATGATGAAPRAIALLVWNNTIPGFHYDLDNAITWNTYAGAAGGLGSPLVPGHADRFAATIAGWWQFFLHNENGFTNGSLQFFLARNGIFPTDCAVRLPEATDPHDAIAQPIQLDLGDWVELWATDGNPMGGAFLVNPADSSPLQGVYMMGVFLGTV